MNQDRILVTGGGGYAGAVLVPNLLEAGYAVRVLDVFMYGREALRDVEAHPDLEIHVGDIRSSEAREQALIGVDAVLHLAAISNDPSSDLDPQLAREVNYDAIVELLGDAKRAGVRRFVLASSSSVYGVKEVPDVTEELALDPITLYAKLKADSEKIALASADSSFIVTVLRPATLCGYSPRQRLDLTVNILTHHAIDFQKITVFGGAQYRPNLHVEDMASAYLAVLRADEGLVQGEIFNVGYENHSVLELAEIVRSRIGESVAIEQSGTNDHRSYRITSRKIERVLGFKPQRTIGDAVDDLGRAFAEGRVLDPGHARYSNVRWMKENAFR